MSFEFRLHAVRQVLGGLLAYPATRLHDVLTAYRDLLATGPDELTVEISIQSLAQPLVVAVVCHAGDPAAGERVIEPLRRLDPLADTVGVVDYTHLTDRPGAGFALRTLGAAGTLEMLRRSLAPEPEYGHWRGASLPELSDAAIDDFARATAEAPREWSIGVGHHLHGAICRRPAHETPMLRPAGSYTYFFHARWWQPDEASRAMAWVDASWRALRSHGSVAQYVNYLSDGSPEAVRAAYGDHHARLVRIKRDFDPANRFHRNRNIAPFPAA